MALEKTTKEDKIELIDMGEWKIVQVRTATIITDDGTEISRTFHRHTVGPADDWSSASTEVKAICDVVHNDTTKAAWEAAQAANLPGQ
tara:strand:- start:298 stop:561 length:264 start_codon:yes stop_codon:yes gene_type:complete